MRNKVEARSMEISMEKERCTSKRKKVLNFPKKMKKILKNLWIVGKEDPRRVIHALKVGIALTLVSLLYLMEPIFEGVGKNALWAVMTVVVVLEFSAGATLRKGLNRGLGTLVAGSLAFFIEWVAIHSGKILGGIFIGTAVFIIDLGWFYHKDRRCLPANSTFLYINPASAIADRLSTTLYKSKIGILFSPEEAFTLVLLMAKDLSFKPSDAPFRGKTSTAHGEPFFRVMVLPNVWTSALTTRHHQSLARMILCSPEMLLSRPVHSPTPTSRHSLSYCWPSCENPSVLLVGLIHKAGPLTVHYPKPIVQKIRSTCSFSLTSHSSYQGPDREYTRLGRRLLLRNTPIGLLCLFNQLDRTLVFALYMVIILAPLAHKCLGDLVLNLYCHQIDYVFGP